MLRALSRATSIGAGLMLTTLTLPVGTAAAATSDVCDPLTSKRLLTTAILETGYNRVWVDTSPTQTAVCFEFPYQRIGSGVIVATAPTVGVPPRVTPGNDPAACGVEILSPSDPVEFRLAVELDTPTSSIVCFTIGGETLSLEFASGTLPSPPTLQIWRDGTDGWIDRLACGDDYVNYELDEGPQTCMLTNARIL